jgi:acyl-CoA oxidase
MQTQEWIAAFKRQVATVGDGMTYTQAAETLRGVVRSGLLQFDDIEKNPEKFFLAHTLLADHAVRLGPGFFIRFTVQYNLFAGTVIALGSDLQIAELIARNKIKPRLGCFGLTEVLAGVNSGLVVETTATLVDGQFIINTPTPGAAKRWISQGLVADEAVVVATCFLNGKNVGAQAFLVSLRDDNGNLFSGIEMKDMGRKTVGNDLDNAEISFHNLKVPLNTLLSRYIKITPDGTVSFPLGNKRSMDMIGQRLFSGRIAVGQAGLAFTRALFASTKAFATNKKCWIPDGQGRLIDVPQLGALFKKADVEIKKLDRFMDAIEKQLCVCLRSKNIPSLPLQQAIAVGKVKCLEGSIELCHALKQDVGSYALMMGTGFEQLDFLQCCKFAEGLHPNTEF